MMAEINSQLQIQPAASAVIRLPLVGPVPACRYWLNIILARDDRGASSVS